MALPKWFTDMGIPRREHFGDIRPKAETVEDIGTPALSLSERVELREKKKALNVALERKSRELAKENRKMTKDERVALREQLSRNLRIKRNAA